MKTKKYKKNKIHCHSRYVICLPFVIPTMPALEPTINIQKSGTWPVIPKTVVFKYFSWPAKSMNVITFEDSLQIWIQSSAPPLKFKISFILLKLYFRKQVFNFNFFNFDYLLGSDMTCSLIVFFLASASWFFSQETSFDGPWFT